MNPRILPLTDDQAAPQALEILRQTHKGLGMVPNLHRTLAHAPVALRAYTDTARTLAGGSLPAALREQIAVAAAGLNGCTYCASAHTALGKRVGVDESELQQNLEAQSSDPGTGAVLAFVRALIESRGDVDDDTLAAVRAAGFTDGEVVEIVAHVALNIFTNTLNVLARTTVDFPVVQLTR